MKANTKIRLTFYGSLLIIIIGLCIFVENPILQVDNAPAGIEKSDPTRLKKIVEVLAAIPTRNYSDADSLDKTAEYIADQFRQAGVGPRFQEFEIKNQKFRNVIVRLGPATGERLVIGAHYDVFDGQPGADDNASGVAGLLELARILTPVQSLKRPLELVAYTLEEPPNFGDSTMGSFIHADSLQKAGTHLKLMIALEMIGYFSDELWSQKYPMSAFYLLYPLRGNYISLIARPAEWGVLRDAKSLFKSATQLPVKSANVPEFVPGITYSDHFSYWQHNFPAMMITDTAFMRNEQYHQLGDTPDRLNFEKMAEVVNGVAAIAVGL